MREKHLTSPSSPEKGATFPFFAITIFGLLSIVSLTIDASSLYVESRHGQNVADTAAYAAAVALKNGASGTAEATAKEICARNGYEDNQCNVIIPPQSGEYVGNAHYAEVRLSKVPPTYFAKIFLGNSSRVDSRGVAGFSSQAASGVGLLVLNETIGKALHYTAKSKITVTNGSAVVNSSSPDAIFGRTAGSLTAPSVEINGKANLGGATGGTINESYTQASGTNIFWRENAPKHQDPLRDIQPPDPATLVNRGALTKSACGSGTITLQPGRYSQITCALTRGLANIYFKPGIYYVDGDIDIGLQASLRMKDGIPYGCVPPPWYRGTAWTCIDPDGKEYVPGAPIAAPGGVLIYVTGKVTIDVSPDVDIGGGVVELYPPNEGPYKGISIFHARDSAEQIRFGNAAKLIIGGTIYAAGPSPRLQSKFYMRQKAEGQRVMSQVIVDTAEFLTGATLNIDWNKSRVAHLNKVTLVE